MAIQRKVWIVSGYFLFLDMSAIRQMADDREKIENFSLRQLQRDCFLRKTD